MDERHPNTAEEVVHPFEVKWIREKHEGNKICQHTMYILLTHTPCKKFTDLVTF